MKIIYCDMCQRPLCLVCGDCHCDGYGCPKTSDRENVVRPLPSREAALDARLRELARKIGSVITVSNRTPDRTKLADGEHQQMIRRLEEWYADLFAIADLLSSTPRASEEQKQDTYHWGEPMPQYAVLGIGAKAWVELQQIEKDGTSKGRYTSSSATISWSTFQTVMNVLRAIRLKDFKAEGGRTPLLRAIQDQLVESFYDPDPADVAEGTAEVDYAKVDWCGVIRDARKQIDKFKDQLSSTPLASVREQVEGVVMRLKRCRVPVVTTAADPITGRLDVQMCRLEDVQHFANRRAEELETRVLAILDSASRDPQEGEK